MEHMEHFTEQLEMPFMQLLGKTKLLDAYLVSKCKSESDAILLCWNKRRTKFTVTRAAEILDMQKSHLSNILNGKKYPPYDMRTKLQLMCGNWAIRQYEDIQLCAVTTFESPEQAEIRMLRARLEAKEMAA